MTVEQTDLDLLDHKLSGAIEVFAAEVDKRLEEIAKAVEGLEQRLALLTLGMGEQIVVTEALVAQLKYETEEERAAFADNMAQARKEMLKLMYDAANGHSMGGSDSESATPAQGVVTEDVPDSSG